MPQLHTLNSIIEDILLESRNNNIGESDQLSRLQIEQWITEYRTLLIKRDIDRGKEINPMYIQEINGIKLEDKDLSNTDSIPTGKKIKVTSIVIPKTIDFNQFTGLLAVTDVFGNIIQVISENRSKYIRHRKYTGNDNYAYIKSGKLYFLGSTDLEYVSIRGIFEDPREIPGFEDMDSPYPIPASMLMELKELIFTKEIDIVAISDNTNDGNNDVSNNSLSRRDMKKISKGIK